MSSNEIQPAKSRGISLRSLLLLVLLVGIGAGATAYVVGSAFAASNNIGTTGPSLQTTTTTSTTTATAHNCTLTST